MEKTIGILGGMGPLATADLFRKITLLTDAARDNDHIRVYIDSNARIPDRTAAILSGGKDPVPEMASALRSLEACGASCVIMPCNTAHYFLPRLQAMTKLPFISMLEATAKTCAAQYPGRTAAVLATKGTLATRLYEQALAAQNVRCLIPDAGEQDLRGLLGAFMFSGQQLEQPTGTLSGGERTRLALAGLVSSAANVLLLDEPTNNLDPISREQVLDALRTYEGAVVLVTHDPGAVEALEPERVIILPDGTEDLWSQEYMEIVELA